MKDASSSAALFHLPPSSAPFLPSFFFKVASRHLNRAPYSPPAVFEEVHLEEVQ